MTSEKDKEIEIISLITDVLIRITAIEKLLLIKGFITGDELSKEIDNIAKAMSMSMLRGANVSGDLEKIVEGLMTGKIDIK